VSLRDGRERRYLEEKTTCLSSMADADAVLGSSAETNVHDPEPDLCVICDAELGSVNVVTTPCNHRFHWSCITPWQRSHNTCPCCRKLLLTVPDEPPEDERDNEADTYTILLAHELDQLARLSELGLGLVDLDMNSMGPSWASESSRFFGHEKKEKTKPTREYDPNSPPTRKGYVLSPRKKEKTKPTREYDPNSPPSRKVSTLSPRKKKKCRCGNCLECRAKKRGSKKGSRKAYEY